MGHHTYRPPSDTELADDPVFLQVDALRSAEYDGALDQALRALRSADKADAEGCVVLADDLRDAMRRLLRAIGEVA